jgi:hypothetical protein
MIKGDGQIPRATGLLVIEEVPKGLPDALEASTKNFRDLCTSLPDWCSKENNGSTCS